MFKTISAAAIVLAFAGTAAAETLDSAGVGHGTTESEVTQLSENLVTIDAHTNYTGFDMVDPDHPFKGVSGPCFGALLIENGTPDGSGLCNYTDADGDKLTLRWTATAIVEGRNTGDWRIIGGTGKWAESDGAGTYDAGTDSEGTYTNNITGEVTLP